MTQYISDNGIPRIVRTDRLAVFMRKDYKQPREKFGIRHIVCPVYDHRGTGKVERLIRTVNGTLGANPETIGKAKQIVLFYQLVSALRTS